MLGIPMPLAITVTSVSWYLPVNAYILRIWFTSFTSVSQFFAINSARNGSPGIKTVLAISPGSALLCGLPILASSYISTIFHMYTLLLFARPHTQSSCRPVVSAVLLLVEAGITRCAQPWLLLSVFNDRIGF